MLTVRIKSSERVNGKIVVHAQIVDSSGDEEKIVLERNMAYPLDADPDQIRIDVANMLTVYEQEQAIGEETAASAKANAQADETIESLQSFEVHQEE